MALNVGYLTAKTDKASDETFTPEEAVLPIVKYIGKDKTVWCPFDIKGQSKYVEVFERNGMRKRVFQGELLEKFPLNPLQNHTERVTA